MYLEYVYRPVVHIFAIFPWTHYMDVGRLSYLVQACQGIPQWSELFFEELFFSLFSSDQLQIKMVHWISDLQFWP